MKLKKNTFIQGAFIATLGIVISKILGIIYVIPFYAIIGDQGGALYGYAYNIYSIFLGISQAGLPLAMSKLISEYNTLGYYETKESGRAPRKSFPGVTVSRSHGIPHGGAVAGKRVFFPAFRGGARVEMYGGMRGTHDSRAASLLDGAGA